MEEADGARLCAVPSLSGFRSRRSRFQNDGCSREASSLVHSRKHPLVPAPRHIPRGISFSNSSYRAHLGLRLLREMPERDREHILASRSRGEPLIRLKDSDDGYFPEPSGPVEAANLDPLREFLFDSLAVEAIFDHYQFEFGRPPQIRSSWSAVIAATANWFFKSDSRDCSTAPFTSDQIAASCVTPYQGSPLTPEIILEASAAASEIYGGNDWFFGTDGRASLERYIQGAYGMPTCAGGCTMTCTASLIQRASRCTRGSMRHATRFLRTD